MLDVLGQTHRTALTKKYRTPMAVMPMRTYRALWIMSPSRERPAPEVFTFDAAVVLMFLWGVGLMVIFPDDIVVLCGGDVVVTGFGVSPLSSANEALHNARNRRKSLKDVMVAWFLGFEARDVTSTHLKFGSCS